MLRLAARRLTALLLLLLLAVPAAAEVNIRSRLDLGELARCIADSGAAFYGAHWCPVCRRQREYFEEHASALPYVECYDASQRKGQAMREICVDVGIRAFPTWIFADGSVATGAQSPLSLAAATDCLGL